MTALALLLCSCRPTPSRGNLDVANISGEEVYSMNCAQCHFAGSGSANAPDLVGSPMVAGPPERLVSIILHGQKGKTVVNGQLFRGVMPAQDYLTDAETAAVTRYVRATFAGINEAVPEELVRRVRTTPAP